MQKCDGSVKYYGKLSNFMLKNYTVMDNADKWNECAAIYE